MSNATPRRPASAAGSKPRPRQPLARQPRNAGAPRQRTTRFKEDGAGGVGTSSDKCFKPSANVMVFRPKWNGGYPLTARIWPNFNPSNPAEFDPLRLSGDVSDFSDFLRRPAAVTYAGLDRKISFNLYDPRDKEYDYYGTNPYQIFVDAITQACKAGAAYIGQKNVLHAEWFHFVDKDHERFCIPKATRLTFLQGFIYANGDDVFVQGGKPPRGADPRDRLTIIQLNKGAGESFEALLNLETEGYQGDSDDLDSRFQYNRFLNIEDGLFVSFFNPKKHKIGEITGEVVPEATVVEEEEEEAPASDGKQGGFVGWGVAMHERFFYTSERKRYAKKADLTPYLDELLNRVAWWDDILHFPEHDELCLWIVSAFRTRPDLIRYAWQDHAEFFTDEVKGVLANRSQHQGAELPTDEDEEVPADQTRVARGRRSSALQTEAAGEDEYVAPEEDEFATDEYEAGLVDEEAPFEEEGADVTAGDEEYVEGEYTDEELGEEEASDEWATAEEGEVEEGEAEEDVGEEAAEEDEHELVDDHEAVIAEAEQRALARSNRGTAAVPQRQVPPATKAATKKAPPPPPTKKAATKKAPPPPPPTKTATKKAPPRPTATKKASRR